MAVTEVSTVSNIISLIHQLDGAEARTVQDALTAHLRHLRDQAALANRASLKSGDRVITENLKPKYLSGLHATVTGEPARRKGDIIIVVDEADRYFADRYVNRYTGKVAVPAGSLRRIED